MQKTESGIITFSTGEKEFLRFEPSGRIYVYGKLTDHRYTIYMAFLSWLRNCTCIKCEEPILNTDIYSSKLAEIQKMLRNHERYKHQEYNPDTGEQAFLYKVEVYFHKHKDREFYEYAERAADRSILECTHNTMLLHQLRKGDKWWCEHCGAIIPDSEVNFRGLTNI